MGHDPLRRYYVVTAALREHETPEECDIRICEQLGVEADTNRVTCKVFEPRKRSSDEYGPILGEEWFALPHQEAS